MLCFRIAGLALVGMFLAVPCQSRQTKEKAPSGQVQAQTKKTDFPLDSLTEFSAIMVGGVIGNIDELHIYRSGKLMRTEMLDGNYMVTNLETRDTFAVLPKKCAHDSRPSVNTFPFSLVTAGHKVERKPLGTEVVEGHSCQVEEVTLTPEQGQPIRLKFWEATDLAGFPIKFELPRTSGDPTTISYKDVKIGPPDPELFKIPARCTAPAPKATKSTGKAAASPPAKKPQ
jgi:hypothetical protein